MNPKYKTRREEKHAADAERRKTLQASQAALLTVGGFDASKIDLIPRGPRSAWIGGKTFKQSNGGQKNRPGRTEEHAQAIAEDLEVDPSDVHNIGGIDENLGLPTGVE